MAAAIAVINATGAATGAIDTKTGAAINATGAMTGAVTGATTGVVASATTDAVAGATGATAFTIHATTAVDTAAAV